MFYFITGTSSSGKTTILNYIKKKYPKFIYINVDDITFDIMTNIRNKMKKNIHYLDNIKDFHKYKQKLIKRKFLKMLKENSKQKVVLIDDFYPTLKKYYNKLQYKKKLILIGNDLNHLYHNLIKRKNSNTRVPAYILLQLMDIYKSSKKCELLFTKKDLLKFNNFSLMNPPLLHKLLKSTIKKFIKFYNLDKKEKICVEPNINYDLFINNKNIKSSYNKIIKFILRTK